VSGVAYEGEEFAGRGLAFGPAPDGFDMSPVDAGGRDVAALSERGSCYLLSSARSDLTGPAPVHTVRYVQQVTGGDGLQSAASFEVSFNPSYERLVIHSLRVLRDGGVREAAEPAAFELLRRELNLERAMYDGRLTAHMIVPDIRVGDIVDTAYSIVGANPVLKGHTSLSWRLQWAGPTLDTVCVMRVPADRALDMRATGAAPEPEDVTADGVRTLTWRLKDAPTWRHESETPGWYRGYAGVRVATRMTWAEVADLFREAYLPPAELPAELEALVDGIAARRATAAERTPEALRLVQTQLRYHSVGVGEGGFRPRPVEAIWATRYGDCKDASRLLVSVLRRLGVEAVPALVDTRYGADLGNQPAYATAFNHCIVRVTVDGETRWLDPTLSPQAGDLYHLTPLRFFRALPLIENATLEVMPDPAPATVCETRETWTFAKVAAGPAELQVRTIYRDWRADDIRAWVENDGMANVSRRMREGLEAEYGQLIEQAPLKITDDVVLNTLTLDETYEVERPLETVDATNMRFVSRDDVVGPALANVESARRLEPISLNTPRRVVTERVFNLPAALSLTAWDRTETGPGLSLRTCMTLPGDRRAVHRLELTVRDRVVQPDDAQDYFAFLRRARANNGVNFAVPVWKGQFGAVKGNSNWGLWLWIGLVALMVAGTVFGGIH
jgi:hypothetical protein